MIVTKVTARLRMCVSVRPVIQVLLAKQVQICYQIKNTSIDQKHYPQHFPSTRTEWYPTTANYSPDNLQYYYVLEEFCGSATPVDNTLITYFEISSATGLLDDSVTMETAPDDMVPLSGESILFANKTYVWYECAENFYRFEGTFHGLCEANLAWSNRLNLPICKGAYQSICLLSL